MFDVALQLNAASIIFLQEVRYAILHIIYLCGRVTVWLHVWHTGVSWDFFPEFSLHSLQTSWKTGKKKQATSLKYW